MIPKEECVDAVVLFPYNAAVPPGYYLLEPGELLTRQDIYWSEKWYRVSATMVLGPVHEGWRCARQVAQPASLTCSA